MDSFLRKHADLFTWITEEYPKFWEDLENLARVRRNTQYVTWDMMMEEFLEIGLKFRRVNAPGVPVNVRRSGRAGSSPSYCNEEED